MAKTPVAHSRLTLKYNPLLVVFMFYLLKGSVHEKELNIVYLLLTQHSNIVLIYIENESYKRMNYTTWLLNMTKEKKTLYIYVAEFHRIEQARIYHTNHPAHAPLFAVICKTKT